MPEGKLIHMDDLEWQAWSHGERLGSRTKALGEAAGCEHVGVVLEELPPGKQSSVPHFHTTEEEHLFVLEGEAFLCWGDEEYQLTPGSYVCFPAGEPRAHYLVNHGSEDCRYIVVGERNPNDVVVYPDHGRMMVRALDTLYHTHTAQWDDT